MTLPELLQTIQPDTRIERESGLSPVLLVTRRRFFVEKFNRAMAYALSPSDICAIDWRVAI